ncbi:MAG: hypothetical protein KBT21_08750 [Treponema sp.]|nr:hypothetical protein [Candidatus Treponema merdequi]
MKALLIADDDIVINKIKSKLIDDGFDVITYKWLVKALDNVEEISPEVIIISASSYPRHWKTLVQFVQSGIEGFIPKIILYCEREFDEDDVKKSEVLNITGIFNSIDEEGLSELSDILANKDSKNCSLIFTNPKNGVFVTGKVSKFEDNVISFIPDTPSYISSLSEDEEILQATLKNKNSIKYISAKIISKTNNNSKIKIQVI